MEAWGISAVMATQGPPRIAALLASALKAHWLAVVELSASSLLAPADSRYATASVPFRAAFSTAVKFVTLHADHAHLSGYASLIFVVLEHRGVHGHMSDAVETLGVGSCHICMQVYMLEQHVSSVYTVS